MSSTPTLRKYDLRFNNKNSKLNGGGIFVHNKCRSCTKLSLENDCLRRQIAILTNQAEDYVTKVNIPFSSNSILVSDEPSGIDISLPGLNAHNQCDKDSSHYSADDVKLSSGVESVETQTNVIHSDVCCGTENSDGDTNDSLCGTDDYSEVHLIDGTDHIICPYNEHTQGVFSMFSLTQLDQHTKYSHNFGNRSVAYYGNNPYSYTGGSHSPRSITENPYLQTILEAVDEHYPNFTYNSAMITRYSNGAEWIPLHSDDEECIAPKSVIMTVSLGETRLLQFKSKSKSAVVTELSLSHGDAVTMTQLSQSYFQHTVPVDPNSKNPRISITLRNIMELPTMNSDRHSEPAPIIGVDPLPNMERTPCNSTARPITVYISSSMFSNLKADKLSSKSQDAFVFYYPGATVSGIEQRFNLDDKRKGIDASRVTKIILMCGTNDVDVILNSPKHLRNKLLVPDKLSPNPKILDNTNRDIERFAVSLHDWAPNSSVNIVNILPRESFSRNTVINDINLFISKLDSKYSYIDMISTEVDRYLFTDKYGYRKSHKFFSRKGEDNVHLNFNGVTRLAKHLKYYAHLN